MVKKLLFFSLIAYVLPFVGMEKAKSDAKDACADMVAIKKWQDAAQFARRVVMYKETPLWIQWGNGYIVTEDPSLRVGYVSPKPEHYSTGEHAYSLSTLIEEKAVGISRQLRDRDINESEGKVILMREPNQQEAQAILTALNSHKACWFVTDYWIERDVREFLAKKISPKE